ncbi:MAG: pentapeptide repeat-containing protein [Chlorobium phaeovibrioides]|nr:pentapeptide repeat-containing protein [Chlorobium phaeovibrioides]
MKSQNALHFSVPLMAMMLLLVLPSGLLSAADSLDVSRLREGSEAWNARRAAETGFVPDLSGADLKGRKFRGFDLHGARLAGADLGQSDLSGANLSGACLDSSNCQGTLLDGAVLKGASLRGSTLDGVVLEGADCSGADFSGADLRRAECSKAGFRGANLQNAHFREASLGRVNFSGADLRGAYLWRAVLDRAVLMGVKVSDTTVLESGSYADAVWSVANGAIFMADVRVPVVAVEHASSLEQTGTLAASRGKREGKVPLKSALNLWRRTGPADAPYDTAQYEMLKSDWREWNRLRRENPSMRVNLTEARYDHKNLSQLNLQGANLQNASLRGTDFSEGDLRGADLRGANLSEASLVGVDLAGADLRGTKLWRANMSRTRLNRAKVSPATVLDSGKPATGAWAMKHGALYMAD